MHYHNKFPNLIEKKGDKFVLKIHCLKKTKRLKYFFGIVDGAKSMKNIYHAYKGSEGFKNSYKYIDNKRKGYLIGLGKKIVNKTIEDEITLDIDNKYDIYNKVNENKGYINNNSDEFFKKIGTEYHNSKYSDIGAITARKPVILLMDNERNKKDQLRSFLNTTNTNIDYDKISCNIYANLYLQTLPLSDDKINEFRERDNKNSDYKVTGIEIEDLYDDDLLEKDFDGKHFSRLDNYNKSKYIGKFEFAGYVKKHYNNINFERFLPVLESIDKIVSSNNSNTLF